MTLHGKSIIAGQPASAGGNVFHAINPATAAELEPDFHEGLPADVNAALNAAVAAFNDFRTCPPEQRARLLESIAAEIEALGDALLQRTMLETGLPLVRLQGERARTCGQLRLFAGVVREGSWIDARIDPALPDRQPIPRPDLRRMLIPIGPVVVFGASNFPYAFSVAGGDTASALAAGCPVVVKAHGAHPGTSELIAGAVSRAVATCGLPAGIFSLVHGGPAVGMALVKHPLTAAVGFTGSHAGGRALFDAAASRTHPIPVFAEMSSVNPVVLLPGAVRERGPALAQGLLTSFTLGVGQFCTKPGLVFVLRDSETDTLVSTLVGLVEKAAGGTMLSPGIRTAFGENCRRITGARGVSVLAPASTPGGADTPLGQPAVAMVSAADFMDQPVLATEAFGPFTLIVLADAPDQITACVHALEGQLTATVHGTSADLDGARALLSLLEQKVGRVVINGFPTGVDVGAAMNHGGPYPATTDVRFTSVGTAALLRFARPVCYQGYPQDLLPDALRDRNVHGLMRRIDGQLTRDDVA